MLVGTDNKQALAMDVVLERLEATAISTDENAENKTNFDALYKNWGKLSNQEDRRKNLLEVQKSNRNTNLDKARGILEIVNTFEDEEYFRPHNRAYYRPSIYVAGFTRSSSYDKILMMSEWMIEKPSDFEENWVVVPSPKGSRVLVIATNGITKLFNKKGHFMLECRTALPGGNPCDPKPKKNCCVLDCFYQKKGNILYVLDVLVWNSQNMVDGELEFRDFWLKSQFSELDGSRISKKNELILSLLPKVSCEPEHFKKFMMKMHFLPMAGDATTLDGLLFYHKRARYFSGETPLVGWLFPFMVPEVLGNHITVNPAYMIQKPANYTNQADYIMEFNSKLEQKKSRRSRRSSQMDTSDVSQTETKPEESTSNPETDKKEIIESMDAEGALGAADKDNAAAEKPNTESMEAEAVLNAIEKDNVAAGTLSKESINAKSDLVAADNNNVDVVPIDTEKDINGDTTKKEESKI